MTLEFITITTRFVLDRINCHYQSICNDFVVSEGFQPTIQIEELYVRDTHSHLVKSNLT